MELYQHKKAYSKIVNVHFKPKVVSRNTIKSYTSLGSRKDSSTLPPIVKKDYLKELDTTVVRAKELQASWDTPGFSSLTDVIERADACRWILEIQTHITNCAAPLSIDNFKVKSSHYVPITMFLN